MFSKTIVCGFWVVFSLGYISLISADICKPCHCLEVEDDLLIITCKSSSSKKIDLDFEYLIWPQTDRFIKAHFVGLGLLVLPKIAGDLSVISLSFDDNLIRSISRDPFEYFPNLQTISLANNFIDDLNGDIFKSTKVLAELNLANNSLTDIGSEVLSHLINLKNVDLSLNQFTKISSELINLLSNVETLNFESNKIFVIENSQDTSNFKWKDLRLSDNKFAIVSSSMFENFKNLQSLDLSHNQLNNIDQKAFKKLDKLKLLDLSYNVLIEANLDLPNSLEEFVMKANVLVNWPLTKIPENLVELHMQHNKLTELFHEEAEVGNIKIFNISGNNIESFPNVLMAKLEVLDLSQNQLIDPPTNMSQMMPMLNTLVLDGNPIENIQFNEPLRVSKLSLSHMPLLRTILAKSFTNIVGKIVRQDGNGTCVDLTVSHCPQLSFIDEGALQDLSLCRLDLSYNNLTEVPINLTNWEAIEDGVDIQGNPFNCSCDSQWLLDVILNQLYVVRKHQYLLLNLKCAYPEHLKNHRFVKYYNQENSFCKPASDENIPNILSAGFGEKITTKEKDENKKPYQIKRGPDFKSIIMFCVILLLIMVAMGIFWTRQQKQMLRRNRLYEDY